MLKLPWFGAPEKTADVDELLAKLVDELAHVDEEARRVVVFHLAAETFPHAIWGD